MFRLIINVLAAMRIYYVPPLRLSEKSRRELESLYPTTGETTNFQSSEGVLLLFRQSPLAEVSAWHMFFQKRLFQVDL